MPVVIVIIHYAANLTSQTAIMNITGWCPPLHHSPEGRIDPANNKLKSPFVVLITGGSEGIGLGCAIAFAKAGASQIIISARSPAKLDTGKGEILSAVPSASVTTVPCDVTVEADVKNLADIITAQFKRLDCVILNAGTSSVLIKRDGKRDFPANFHEAPLDNMRYQMELNVLANWVLSKYLLPILEETTDGPQAIALMGSAAAHCTYTADHKEQEANTYKQIPMHPLWPLHTVCQSLQHIDSWSTFTKHTVRKASSHLLFNLVAYTHR
jgi:NAD(P)-dependent dehydrogenase (short-subunit alcohol dehydrogenase family)